MTDGRRHTLGRGICALPFGKQAVDYRRPWSRWLRFAAVALAAVLPTITANADAPAVTVGYQPMVSTGLAARQPFEAWFVLGKSFDPAVPGYAIPGGASIRFTFSKAFTPAPGAPVESVMIKWEQGSVPTRFTVSPGRGDPRSIVIRFDQPLAPEADLKAIHLRSNQINPAAAGAYPISVQFIDAGPLSGTTDAIAHITSQPVPNIAAYNQLHLGKDEDWQHVKAGTEAALPIDFLVTDPDAPRSAFSLAPSDAGLSILRDGTSIGSVVVQGVPVSLTAVSFGPGFSRLGIVELRAKAGMTPGQSTIVAALKGGARTVIHLEVEAP